MIGGGLLAGDSTLVAGSPGTGKTTLGLHFVAAGVVRGEPGVYVTFEYLPQQIYRDARKRGWDLEKWEDEGMLRVVCTEPDLLLAELDGGGSTLDRAIRETRAKRLVVDSMAHFTFAGEPGPRLRGTIAGLANHLRVLQVTSLLLHEVPQIVGPAVTISDFGLEFLVDNIVLLRYVELDGELQKALAVLKFRGGDHDRRYHLVRLTDQGILVGGELRGVENISGGSARHAFGQRAKEMI